MNATVTRGFFRAFGPGLLLAAVAIGVSHLVQSTRAGALYGPLMVLFVLAAMAIKYPFFRFGPLYTTVTGCSLIHAVRRQGLWVYIIFALLVVTPSFIGLAALASGTALVASSAFALNASLVQVVIALLLINIIILCIGRYHWLDLLMKVCILLLSCTTIAATVITIPVIDWPVVLKLFPPEMNRNAIIFIVALVGWMPAPLEGAVMHSLWTRAKSEDSGYRPKTGESVLDFHIGYLGTLILSLCFMLLGAGVLQEHGGELARSAPEFTRQFIALYESTLGEWSGILVRFTAVAVMYSTLLTATDSYARMISGIVLRFATPEQPWQQDKGPFPMWLHIGLILVLSAGSLVVFLFMSDSFPILLALATSMAFLACPFIAFLIYRAITSSEVPDEYRPGRPMQQYTMFCIATLVIFAAAYVWILSW